MVPFRQFLLVSALEPCLWFEECDLDTRRKTLKKKEKEKKNFEKKKYIFFCQSRRKGKASRAVVELAAFDRIGVRHQARNTHLFQCRGRCSPSRGGGRRQMDGLKNQNAWGGGRTRVPSGSNSSQPPEPESQPSDPV